MRGRLAQLARASGLHPEGRRFKSCTAHYMKKIWGRVFGIGGIFSGFFALAGALGWCCLPFFVWLFGLFGISSMVLVLYSKWFLIISSFFFGLFFLYVIRNTKRRGKNSYLYSCPECGFLYKEKKWALECQKWCEKHQSCNLDIIRHGIAPKRRREGLNMTKDKIA